MLDEYFEEEDDLKFPEVPNDIPDPKKAEVWNVDKEIESRLVKLKFFNQTWLKDVTESKKTDNEVSKTDILIEDTDDQLVAVEEENNVKPSHEMALDPKAIETEPVFSTKEDADAFNDWY